MIVNQVLRNMERDLPRPSWRRNLLRVIGAVGLGGLGACDSPEEPPSEPRPLIDHANWERIADLSDDPFADWHQPDHVCDDPTYVAEDFGGVPSLQLWTRDCNFITLEQPALDDVAAGETLRVNLWHFPLTAPEGGEAHMALWAGGNVLWEHKVPIPQEMGALIDEEVEVPENIAAGDAVVFHLNNHGINTYNLLDVLAR